MWQVATLPPRCSKYKQQNQKSSQKLEWDSSSRCRCNGLINMIAKKCCWHTFILQAIELSNRLENLEMVQQASAASFNKVTGTYSQTLIITVVSVMHVMTTTGTWNNVSKPITGFRDHVVLQWILNELCAVGYVELINVECRSCYSSYTVGAV